MTIRLKNELLLIAILVVLLIILITVFHNNILRIILGVPFLLFFPGYALLAALFPRRTDWKGIELLALGFGLSLVVVACIGFILNYTRWGVQLYPVLISIAAFILIASIIAWARRRRLNEEEKPTVSFHLNWQPWQGQSGIDKMLSIVLIMVVLGTAGSIGYVVAGPGVEEQFTEFYLLGAEGRIADYPDNLILGEEATVIVVVVNHEREDMNYGLEVTIDGNRYGKIEQIALVPEEKWEQEVSFVPVRAGERQKVEFVLYKNDEPYRRLFLRIDVREPR